MVTQTKNNAADAAAWPRDGRTATSRGTSRAACSSSSRPIVWPPARVAPVPARRCASPSSPRRPGSPTPTTAAASRCSTSITTARSTFTSPIRARPSLLYHNLGVRAGRHWLGLALVGRPETPMTVGARSSRARPTRSARGSRSSAAALKQIREVSGGTGFASQSERRVHFGLGDARPERMTVRWPSGRTQSFGAAELAPCVDGYARLIEVGALEPGRGAPARPAASRARGARPRSRARRLTVSATAAATRPRSARDPTRGVDRDRGRGRSAARRRLPARRPARSARGPVRAHGGAIGARASRRARRATAGTRGRGQRERFPGERSALARAAQGLREVRGGDVAGGIDALKRGGEIAPQDLVIGNAYRMAVFHLKRAALADPARVATLAGRLPAPLDAEPLPFLERLAREHRAARPNSSWHSAGPTSSCSTARSRSRRRRASSR